MASKKVLPSFESFAQQIVDAFGVYDSVAGAASDTLADAVRTSVQSFLDVCATAGVARDQKGCEWIALQIRGCQVAVDSVASGLMMRATWTNYAQGAQRAHFHACEWNSKLFQDPDRKLPWSKKVSKGAKTPTATEPSAPEVTTQASLMLSLQSALKVCRKINPDLASDLLDDIIDAYPEFKE